MSDPITAFRGAYRWLSNFWPIPIQLDGVWYPSVEHAYQAAKTDPDHRGPFTHGTAGEAKRRGRQVPLRADWDDIIKVACMRNFLAQKFAPGSALAAQLRATSPAYLMEGNDWGDTFWGVSGGDGLNMLGRLLMEQRNALWDDVQERP